MPIRLWSTVVSHAHTSLLMCERAWRTASSGIAMLGWPPAVYEAPSGLGIARAQGLSRARSRTVDRRVQGIVASPRLRMRDNSRELRVRPWAARLRRRGRHRPVFLAEGGED